MNQPILRIVSGGQTGADRAGLDWAIKNGIPHEGENAGRFGSNLLAVPRRFDLVAQLDTLP
jgi:hypothetical protein